MRIGRLTPAVVVDVKKVAELNVLAVGADGLHLGAAVPSYRIYGDPAVSAQYSGLADSCRILGGVQIQSRASVGGNLCNAAPSADMAPPLLALDAEAVIAGPAGERRVPLASFFTGVRRTVLDADELLVELVVPAPASRRGSAYLRHTPRPRTAWSVEKHRGSGGLWAAVSRPRRSC